MRVTMKGRICALNRDERRGRVDTRKDDLGVLTIYFDDVPVGLSTDDTVEFQVKTSKAGNKYAKFISIVERNQALFNTEDRSKWYEWGGEREPLFVSLIAQLTGRDIRINPEKAECPWAIDLYDFTMKRPADLKTQNTPFFTAGKYLYDGRKCDPAYSVTFNKKDYEHYLEDYPDCDIYFWVDWNQLTYGNISVPHIAGVWRGDFRKMAKKIQAGKVALHSYDRRRDDDHNARDSYIFDLRDTEVFERLEGRKKLKGPSEK